MSYQLLLTDAGAAKVAAAANAGGLIHLTDFVIGQGVNVDFSTRLDKQVLVSKRYQGKVQSVAAQSGNPRQYEITCIVPPDVGGFTIREFGLVDDTGALIWVGSLPEVQKPDTTSTAAVDYRIKAVVQVDNPQVSIVIDANVVTATQSWVNANFAAIGHQHKDMLDRLKALENRIFEAVAVWGIYTTHKQYANSDEVHADLHYGTWALYAQGQVLAGFSTLVSDDAKFKTVGNIFQIGSEGQTQDVVIVQFWIRLPDDYIEPIYNIYWTADAEGANKVTEFAETDNIYLWIEASNLTNSSLISSINVLAVRHTDTDAVAAFNNSTVNPDILQNGKNLVYAISGSDQGYFTSDVDLSVNVQFTDTAINQQKTLSANTVVHDTVNNQPVVLPMEYTGIKFNVLAVNNNGNWVYVPEVIENNSPLTVATDPGIPYQGIAITNIPDYLQNVLTTDMDVEQTAVSGGFTFAKTRYDPQQHYLTMTSKDLRNQTITSGTIVNTIKLSYIPQ